MTKQTLSLLLTLAAAPTLSAQTIAIVGGQVHTQSSGDVIENGTVLVTDGVITAVGPTAAMTFPSGTSNNRCVWPCRNSGFYRRWNTDRTCWRSAASPTPAMVPLEATTRSRSAFRVSDAINPNSIIIPITRTGGITTVGSRPSGGLISGRGSADRPWRAKRLAICWWLTMRSCPAISTRSQREPVAEAEVAWR